MKNFKSLLLSLAILTFFVTSCAPSKSDIQEQVKSHIEETWKGEPVFEDAKVKGVDLTVIDDTHYKGELTLNVDGEDLKTEIKVKIVGEKFEWEVEPLPFQIAYAAKDIIETDWRQEGVTDILITDITLIKRIGNEYTGEIELEKDGKKETTSIEVVTDKENLSYTIDVESVSFFQDSEDIIVSQEALEELEAFVSNEIVLYGKKENMELTVTSIDLEYREGIKFTGTVEILDNSTNEILSSNIVVEYNGEDVAWEIVE